MRLDRRKMILWSMAAVGFVLNLMLGDKRSGAQTSDDSDPGATVKCANLVYAVDKSSVCFSDHFLTRLQNETNIDTAPSFQTVRLDSDDLYKYPFSIMTGEGGYALTPEERIQMKHYVTHGGFLLASSGCSDPDWTRSFRSEMAQMFPSNKLTQIPLSHPIYRTIYTITEVKTTHQMRTTQLEGLTYQDHLIVVFSPDGLNDTADIAGDCCCCGGDEIDQAERINVNILSYALMH